MQTTLNKLTTYKPQSFWQEFRARCGFVGVIALTNPVFVTFYVMFLHNAPGGLQFWLVGILLTAIVVVISSITMAMIIYVERRRRFSELKRDLMWHDVMPYDGANGRRPSASVQN